MPTYLLTSLLKLGVNLPHAHSHQPTHTHTTRQLIHYITHTFISQQIPQQDDFTSTLLCQHRVSNPRPYWLLFSCKGISFLCISPIDHFALTWGDLSDVTKTTTAESSLFHWATSTTYLMNEAQGCIEKYLTCINLCFNPVKHLCKEISQVFAFKSRFCN